MFTSYVFSEEISSTLIQNISSHFVYRFLYTANVLRSWVFFSGFEMEKGRVRIRKTNKKQTQNAKEMGSLYFVRVSFVCGN